MAEEGDALVLDVIPNKDVPGEEGTAVNGVLVPAHDHLPPAPSPTSSFDGERKNVTKKGKGIFLKLDTGALDKMLSKIIEKVETHDQHLGRLDVLEQEVSAALLKAELQLRLSFDSLNTQRLTPKRYIYLPLRPPQGQQRSSSSCSSKP